MPQSETPKRSWRESVRAPLLFSLVIGVIAFAITLFAATGGSENRTRWDLALIGFGIAFIVSLVVCAMLMMLERPNPSQLGEGSGVHRASAKIPGGAANADNVRDTSHTSPAGSPARNTERDGARDTARETARDGARDSAQKHDGDTSPPAGN